MHFGLGSHAWFAHAIREDLRQIVARRASRQMLLHRRRKDLASLPDGARIDVTAFTILHRNMHPSAEVRTAIKRAHSVHDTWGLYARGILETVFA